MTITSILGVAIGVGTLTIVLSVMGGFEGDLRRKMLAGEPNLEIVADNATAGFSLREYPLEKFAKALPDATAIEPFTTADVVLKRRSFMASATLIGVRPEQEGKHLWAFDGAFVEGELKDLAKNHRPTSSEARMSTALPGIVLGDQLATQLNAEVGDLLMVLSPQANVGSVLSGSTLSRTYVVTGKISTDIFNYDIRWAIVSLTEGRRFMPDFDQSLLDEEYVTGIGANFRDPMKVDTAAKRITDAMPGLKVLTWQMTNKALLLALKLEKFTMGSILMLIVLVATFSICGTMMMTAYHKQWQVSLMRSLGMTQKDIWRVFLCHGLTIGGVGVVLGLAGGLGICFIIKVVRTIPLPEGIYYLRALPVKYLPLEYGVIVLFAFLLTLCASLYPAATAARQNPSLGMRGQ